MKVYLFFALFSTLLCCLEDEGVGTAVENLIKQDIIRLRGLTLSLEPGCGAIIESSKL